MKLKTSTNVESHHHPVVTTYTGSSVPMIVIIIHDRNANLIVAKDQCDESIDLRTTKHYQRLSNPHGGTHPVTVKQCGFATRSQECTLKGFKNSYKGKGI
ncbi:unnamed protein product [Allacma fusca]|uniref:Uncharacterized protein n=1 Tax=Allacma fusca TaxID=39272 RepID=A0A8J2LHQ7_9HEXA|nr:unnamed protein product [Allacma fusca]